MPNATKVRAKNAWKHNSRRCDTCIHTQRATCIIARTIENPSANTAITARVRAWNLMKRALYNRFSNAAALKAHTHIHLRVLTSSWLDLAIRRARSALFKLSGAWRLRATHSLIFPFFLAICRTSDASFYRPHTFRVHRTVYIMYNGGKFVSPRSERSPENYIQAAHAAIEILVRALILIYLHTYTHTHTHTHVSRFYIYIGGCKVSLGVIKIHLEIVV